MKYQVVLRADVVMVVEVDADSDDAAERLAYAEIGDDYEVDFYAESVYEIEDNDQ